MPKRVLTDKAIQALKSAAEGQRYIIGDALVPGLGVRVTDSGHKTYVLGARYPGSPHFKRREIGEVGAVTLAAARDKARAWIANIKLGRDPREVERAAATAAMLSAANTFASVAEEFILRHVKGKRKAKVVEREIRTELIPVLGARPISEITRRDIVQLVEAIADRGRTAAHARNIYGHVKTLFNWAIARDIYGLEVSPCDRVRPKALFGEKRVRTRVLDDDELRALWRAAGRVGYPFGSLVQWIILTGCRLSEGAEARWSEFGPRLWTIPSERFKMGETHIVPLTEAMTTLLNTLPRWKRGDCLFSMSGKQPIAGFSSRAKAKLDREMARSWRALGRVQGIDRRNAQIENWSPHDLRRTLRTRLSALRVPEQTAELVIGHAKKGLARVYDQHKYLDEVREALALWNSKLEAIIQPPPPNVVTLRGVS
jgi:integrase